jgi:hypothetical protein
MSDTEQQSEQALSAWPFAKSYEGSYSNLPPSQLREAMRRLTERKRSPLSAETLTQEDPEIEGVLSGVKRAYLAKKERAKVASATKRASQREVALAQDNVVAEVEAAEDLTASVAGLSLEPAEVVAVEPVQEPVVPCAKSEPEPALVKPTASKPVAIPLARQQTQQAQQPRTQTKKTGLAAKFMGQAPYPTR